MFTCDVRQHNILLVVDNLELESSGRRAAEPTSQTVEEDRVVRRARPALDSRDMDSWSPGKDTTVNEASTPVVVGDRREAPQYGDARAKEGSRKW